MKLEMIQLAILGSEVPLPALSNGKTHDSAPA
jgi:hypothetical protein